MKLILTALTHKTTTRNNLPYVEMTFYYGEKSKTVKYSVWSFIHTEANGLLQVWNNAKSAVVGNTYNVRFQKVIIEDKEQFVVTLMEEITHY